MASNLKYEIEHLGHHHGQDDMELGLYMDDEIIGLVQYTLFDGELSVKDILVRPEFRRQGYGSRMMKYIKQAHPEYKYVPSLKTDLGAKFVHKDVALHEIRKIVRNVLRESFFKEGYDDVGVEHIKNNEPKLSDVTEFENKKVVGDITLINKKYGTHDFWIRAYDNTDGTEIGNSFYSTEGKLLKASVDVRPDVRRRGVATQMYKWIEELTGRKLVPDLPHSDKAKKFWSQPNRPFGEKWIEENNKKELKKCPNIKLTQQIIDEVSKYETDEELLRAGGISLEVLDYAAHGFSENEIKTLMPKQLHIKWVDDWENVKWEQEKSGLSKKEYSNRINLSEPIDVSYEKGKFYVEDGHHRLFAASVLNKPLNVNLEIKENPIKKLAPNLGYDEFHRCVFKQVKEMKK